MKYIALLSLAALMAFAPLTTTHAQLQDTGTIRACLIIADGLDIIDEGELATFFSENDIEQFELDMYEDGASTPSRTFTGRPYLGLNTESAFDFDGNTTVGSNSLCSKAIAVPYGNYTYAPAERDLTLSTLSASVTFEYYEQISVAQLPTFNRLRDFGTHPLADSIIELNASAPNQTLFVLASFVNPVRTQATETTDATEKLPETRKVITSAVSDMVTELTSSVTTSIR